MDSKMVFPKVYATMGDSFPENLAREHERILGKIEEIWGTPDAPKYIQGLLFSERPGRRGFSTAVMDDLTVIKQMHDENHPDMAMECLFAETGGSPSMKDRDALASEWVSRFGNGTGELFVRTAKGCDKCHGSGYDGRVGIYEMMPVTKQVASAIRNRISAGEIRSVAISEGMRILKRDGMEKVFMGVTDMLNVRGACS